MKKGILYTFIAFLLIGLIFILPTTKVKAEEIDEPETTETQPAEYKEIDLEEIVVDIADKYLGEYVDRQLIANIVSIATGVLGYLGLIITNIIYKKYKKNTVDDFMKALASNDGAHLQTYVKDLKEEILSLKAQNLELKKGYDTVVKALVLSQDNTAKGKIALLEYLGVNTDNQETKAEAEQITKKLEEEQAKKEEVNAKVSGEYNDLF